MNAALARVEAGVTGGIVVARLDRFARTVVGGLTTIQQLHESGRARRERRRGDRPGDPDRPGDARAAAHHGRMAARPGQRSAGRGTARAATAGRFPGKPSYGYRKDGARARTLVDMSGPRRARIFTRGPPASAGAIADRLNP
jgi:hypothetical protein